MFGSTVTVIIKEYPLPAVAGSFTLEMDSQRAIVGVIKKADTNILLSQERIGSGTEESNFELVESGTQVRLTSDFEAPVQYLATFIVEGKLLHLFGVATMRSMGGANSLS